MATSPEAHAARTLPPFPFRIVVADEAADGPARIKRVLGPTVTVVTVDGLDALDRELRTHVDILIVERCLPWGDSLAVLQRALAAVPSLAVMVLTDRGDERLAVASLRAGACGYLRKSVTDDRLRDALLQVLSPWNSHAADDPAGVPALLEAVNVGFIRSAPDGQLLDANPAVARMAGLGGAAALQGWNTRRFYPSHAHRDRYITAMDAHGVQTGIIQMRRADGTPVMAETDARAVKHADGHTLAYEGHVRDVTDRERLHDQLAFQASLLDKVAHIVVALDNDLRIRYWNRNAEQTLGWSPDEVMGRPVLDVVVPADEHEAGVANMAQLVRDGALELVSDDVTKDGGRLRTRKWMSKVVGTDGAPVGWVVVAVDVRELHERERELERALADREALLREIHHRVKNNLQVVSSLLSLQARRAGAPTLRDAVRACQMRLRAIGAVHEELYRAPGVATVAIGDFLDRMVARLASMGDDVPAVRLGRITPSAVGVDLAADLGLVLTELCLSWANLDSACVRAMRLRVDLDVIDGDVVLGVTDDAGDREQARSSAMAAIDRGLVEELTGEIQCAISFADEATPSVSVRFTAGAAK